MNKKTRVRREEGQGVEHGRKKRRKGKEREKEQRK